MKLLGALRGSGSKKLKVGFPIHGGCASVSVSFHFTFFPSKMSVQTVPVIVSHEEYHAESHEKQDESYALRKAPRFKYRKGVLVRSGRSVRACNIQSTKVFANEDNTDHGWFHVYSYPNGNRYSDKSEYHAKGKGCCGPSHVCIHLVERHLARRGRALKIASEDLDFVEDPLEDPMEIENTEEAEEGEISEEWLD
jgi:hypothetical protein